MKQTHLGYFCFHEVWILPRGRTIFLPNQSHSASDPNRWVRRILVAPVRCECQAQQFFLQLELSPLRVIFSRSGLTKFPFFRQRTDHRRRYTGRRKFPLERPEVLSLLCISTEPHLPSCVLRQSSLWVVTNHGALRMRLRTGAVC